MADFQTLTGMTEAEYQREIEKAEREVMRVRMHLAATQEKDHSKFKKARKEVARLMTARRQSQLGISHAQ